MLEVIKLVLELPHFLLLVLLGLPEHVEFGVLLLHFLLEEAVVLPLRGHGSINLGLDQGIEPAHALLGVFELLCAGIALFYGRKVLLVLILELLLKVLDLLLSVYQLLSQPSRFILRTLPARHRRTSATFATTLRCLS